ncbi:peptidylprolyl isomerase [Devosia neptuniae]|jgi:peptidyl-prolyl cis-trans isomerase C|uniref:Parvulin-like PPIase n=1 Tax=Devosia neptuniae TaxID=191302 RepID=A0ABY6CHG9_9HYPH|nr:peptidylprolyl isomerase [Devosia neptuniae]UXN71675.1 peptidylprolyl isomerase [Devosia neptuniae]
MSFSTLRLATTASVLALLMAANAVAPAFAQDAAPAPAAEAPAAEAPAPVSPDAVVATVGGETITEADLSFAAEDLTQELSQMPADQRRPFLLRVLIDMKVMAKAGRDAGMGDTPLFKQRLAYLEERALRRAYFADAIANSVTEEAVRAEYDKLVADFKPAEEIRASHILVATEEEAKAIKAELDGGADFATIAKEKSIDPGAANGGDLGFFGKGMMVAPFEEAAYALTEIGQVSEPVQSQFGWHIIKLEEKRESAPPTFEQVASQLQQQLLMTTFDGTVAKLMEGVTIDIPDAALDAAVKAQSEPAAAAGEGEAAPAAQ